MARGNGRQKIVHDGRDYPRLLDAFEAVVDKFGFEILSFACMPNHLFSALPGPISPGECNTCSPVTPIGSIRVTGDRDACFRGDFAQKRRKRRSRDIAAWLLRRLTVATLREFVEPFDLGHPDSVRSLLGRAEAAMQ